MQLSGPRLEPAGRPQPREGDSRGLPFQWSLLAWAALVGVLTGAAVVGFHYLLGFINNFLFGTLVEWGTGLLGSAQPDPTPPEIFTSSAPSGTPLKALVLIGLGGIGFLPPPPLPPVPLPLPVPASGLAGWFTSWPVLLAPVLGGVCGAAAPAWARSGPQPAKPDGDG